jgi:hypothetical protein
MFMNITSLQACRIRGKASFFSSPLLLPLLPLLLIVPISFTFFEWCHDMVCDEGLYIATSSLILLGSSLVLICYISPLPVINSYPQKGEPFIELSMREGRLVARFVPYGWR